MTATATSPTGQTIDFSWAGTQFKFASFYTDGVSDKFMIKVHRTEKQASKGQWDSAEMKKVWHYAGYAPIAR